MYEHREEGRQAGRQQRRFLVAFSDQTSFFLSMTVAYSDSHPALYVVHGRAKPVLRGPNSTDPNLFHHGYTSYRAG